MSLSSNFFVSLDEPKQVVNLLKSCRGGEEEEEEEGYSKQKAMNPSIHPSKGNDMQTNPNPTSVLWMENR
jgi:hypothetical protein